MRSSLPYFQGIGLGTSKMNSGGGASTFPSDPVSAKAGVFSCIEIPQEHLDYQMGLT